jgi:pyruvyl transferase EpsO
MPTNATEIAGLQSGPGKMPHSLVMARLKERLSGIKDILPLDRPLVYLDYPVHDNVGDLLIHQGADAFLKDYGYRVLGEFSTHDFCERIVKTEPNVRLKPSIRRLDELVKKHDATIVMHGGGNFGDIWPEFQQFREFVVERYPASRIVVFPQSIHFSSQEAQSRAARLFGQHKKLFIFVRDAESLAFVRQQCGLPGEVMPDMAHQLWGRLPVSGAGNGSMLVQRRRDKETRSAGNVDRSAFDWDDLETSRDVFTIRALRKWQLIDNPLQSVVSNYTLWRMFRDNLINRAVEKLKPYSGINTDRLHGMILGALMGKKVEFGDGSYGKLHRYAQVWLGESDLIESADR